MKDKRFTAADMFSSYMQHASAKEPTLARPTSVGWAAQSSSSTVVGTVEEEGESCCGTVMIAYQV